MPLRGTLRVVLFDIDDTLIDHSTAMRRATEALHADLQLNVPFEHFHAKWMKAHRQHYPSFLRGEVSYQAASRSRLRETVGAPVSDQEADRLFTSYLASYESGWTLFPDVMECLDGMGSFRLGIISNGLATEQRRKLATFGLFERFEHVVVSEECGFAKPAAEIFYAACNAMGVPKAEALYVGDQYELDVQAARAAGLRSVWLDRRGKASSEHSSPVISSLADLRHAIAAISRPRVGQ